MRVLSGIQPTGRFHWGNYFGAIRQYIDLQHGNDAYYFIANLHALTTIRDPAALRQNTIDAALDLLALGLDPSKAVLFEQSDVPEVTELTWLLMSITPMGLLERCVSYKDKVSKGLAAAAGLFTYPVLMAADILIYDSDIVPVGKDQKQHIEITRDIATRINETYGGGPDPRLLKLPEPRIQPQTEVVPGIDGQKMSKSYGNTIDIFGDERETRKRVMSIVTDSTPVEAPKNPEASAIVQLYSLLAAKDEIEDMRAQFRKGGHGYGEFKKQLFDKLWDYFAPMRKRRDEILADKDYVDDVLERGAQRANTIANEVMKRVRHAVGL